MLKEAKSPFFDKDVKALAKKHYKFNELFKVIEILKNSETLPGKYRDHSLSGNYKGYRECHIDDNILLIYRVIDNKELILYRIGNHKDLLNK